MFDVGIEADWSARGTTVIESSACELYPVGQLAAVLDVDRVNIYRWVKAGLTCERADELAIQLGVNPLSIWPDYYNGFVLDAHHEQQELTCT